MLGGPSRNTIESVAHHVALELLRRHASVQSVFITIRKPHVALEGPFKSIGGKRGELWDVASRGMKVFAQRWIDY